MSACVIIPTFNAAEALERMLPSVRAHGCEVLVVDDGSSDATAAVAGRAGTRILTHPVNLGKGAALQTGFAEAVARGYELIITMDADGQHDPSDIPRFVQAARDHQDWGLIIGNRMTDSHRMPLVRRWTNRLMSWWLSRVAGCQVPDTQCGFRLIRRELLARCRLRSAHFEIESELVLEAARLGVGIGAVPIHARYAGEGSHIHPLRDTLRFLRMLASYKRTHEF